MGGGAGTARGAAGGPGTARPAAATPCACAPPGPGPGPQRAAPPGRRAGRGLPRAHGGAEAPGGPGPARAGPSAAGGRPRAVPERGPFPAAAWAAPWSHWVSSGMMDPALKSCTAGSEGGSVRGAPGSRRLRVALWPALELKGPLQGACSGRCAAASRGTVCTTCWSEELPESFLTEGWLKWLLCLCSGCFSVFTLITFTFRRVFLSI